MNATETKTKTWRIDYRGMIGNVPVVHFVTDTAEGIRHIVKEMAQDGRQPRLRLALENEPSDYAELSKDLRKGSRERESLTPQERRPLGWGK